MTTKRSEAETNVNPAILQRMIEVTEAALNGDLSQRVVVDFDDSLVSKMATNINQWLDQAQLNKDEHTQKQTVNNIIEVISSYANLDFKQKLPVSENGTVMDAIATGINILGEELEQTTTSKQELERERNKLNEAQAIAKVGSWELDVTTLKLNGSIEAFRLFGLENYPTSALFEVYRAKIFRDDLPNLDYVIKRAIDQGEDFMVELRVPSDEGSDKHVLCIGAPLRGEDKIIRSIKGTVQDISERKRIEKTLQEAKEYAEEANNAKTRFLANMSHEIRTPLNGILGLTEIMLGEELSEEHRKYLGIISDSGKNLARLINDILDLSKIESKKLELENIAFDLRKLVLANVNSYKFLAEQKGLELSSYIDENMPIEVMGDPTRLSQILTNLISNAIKFTEEGSIHISLFNKGVREDEVTIYGSVKDTGTGIPPGKLDTIFQSFTQADDTITRKYGGTGLGLSIVKNLLTQMKGSIHVQSPADVTSQRGAVFNFTLKLKLPPRYQQTERTAGQLTKVLHFARPITILVVDDNPVNLLVAKKMLRKLGANVTIAGSGYDAIHLVKKNSFDLILMDIQMPGINGYETAAELKKIDYTYPIIALSANAYEEDVQLSLSSGMLDHIKKPYTELDLFNTIIQHVK
jgi:signal transduction histidine kinase/CheY-like chemotaxis protein